MQKKESSTLYAIKKSIIITPIIVLIILLILLQTNVIGLIIYDVTQNGYVSITNTTAQELKEYYLNNENEFSVCLNIEREDYFYNNEKEINTTYIINSIDGDVTYGGLNYVESGHCEHAKIHSHPSGDCRFSTADIRVFKENIKKGMYLNVVMCGEDKFIYITRNYFKEKWVKII